MSETEFLQRVPADVAAQFAQLSADERFLLRVVLTQVERMGVPNGRLRLDEAFLKQHGWWPLPSVRARLQRGGGAGMS